MEYEEALEQSIQYALSDLDGCCRAKLPQMARRLVGETPPYPPGHLMTVARFVFVLAYRVFNDETHPDAAPGWSRYKGEGSDSRRFLDYIDAVFRLNDAIDGAARAGKIRLNERRSGAALADWPMPDKSMAVKLHSALTWDSNDRAAAETLVRWPIWYPHISSDIVLEPNSFVAWIESEGIAAPGETMALVHALKNASWPIRGYASFPKEIYPLHLKSQQPMAGASIAATATATATATTGNDSSNPAANTVLAPAVSKSVNEVLKKARNHWDDEARRKLYAESITPGATTATLAKNYGITGEGIRKQLREAKKLSRVGRSPQPTSLAWKRGK